MKKILAALAAVLTLGAAAPALAATPDGGYDRQIVFHSQGTTTHACTGEITASRPWMMVLRWRPYGAYGQVDFAFTNGSHQLLFGGAKRGGGTWNMSSSMLRARYHYQLCVTLVNPGAATLYAWYYG